MVLLQGLNIKRWKKSTNNDLSKELRNASLKFFYKK